MAADRRHAHRLLDELGPDQLAAVVRLLEVMVHDEEDRDTLSNAERKAVAGRTTPARWLSESTDRSGQG